MYTLNPVAPLGALNRCRVVSWDYDRDDDQGTVYVEVGHVSPGVALVYPQPGTTWPIVLRNAGECVGLRITAAPTSFLDRVQIFAKPASGELNGAVQAADAAVQGLAPGATRAQRRAAIAGALETYLVSVGLLPASA